MAFNAKNLSYESKVPAFLQRMQAEIGGNTIDRPNPRPRRAPREEDEDDEPTYVLEGNETISREEFRAMNEEANSKPEADNASKGDTVDTKAVGGNDSSATAGAKGKGREKILEVGKTKQKKRKAVKVAGSDDESEKASADEKREAYASAKDKDEAKDKTNKSIKKAKKQKKAAVKLSFGDEGE